MKEKKINESFALMGWMWSFLLRRLNQSVAHLREYGNLKFVGNDNEGRKFGFSIKY